MYSKETKNKLENAKEAMGYFDLKRLDDYCNKYNKAQTNGKSIKWAEQTLPDTIPLDIFGLRVLKTNHETPDQVAQRLIEFRVREFIDDKIVNGTTNKILKQIEQWMEEKEKIDKEIIKLVTKYNIDPGELKNSATLKDGNAVEIKIAGLLEKSDKCKEQAHASLLGISNIIEEIRESIFGHQALSAEIKVEHTKAKINRRATIEEFIHNYQSE